MGYAIESIEFGDANDKRVVILGEGRRSLFRHIRDHGHLPEGWTLLSNGKPIGYDEIDWNSLGDLGKPRAMGTLKR